MEWFSQKKEERQHSAIWYDAIRYHKTRYGRLCAIQCETSQIEEVNIIIDAPIEQINFVETGYEKMKNLT